MKRKIRINTCKRLNVRYNLTINDIQVITSKYYFGNYLKLSVNDEESDFSVFIRDYVYISKKGLYE